MSGAHTSVRSVVLQVALSSCATCRRGSAVQSWYRLVIGERASLSLRTHITLHTLSPPVKAHTRAVLPSTQLAGNRYQHRAPSSWRIVHCDPRRDQRVRTTISRFMRAASACSLHGARASVEVPRRRQSSRWRGSKRAADHRCGHCMSSAVLRGVGALSHGHLVMPCGVLPYSAVGCAAADFWCVGASCEVKT